MSAENPDPSETAGLERGDTPPAETGVGGPQHEPPQRTLKLPVIFLGVLGVVVLIVVIGLIGRVIGLI